MIMIDAIVISISEGLTFERIYEGKIKKMRFPPFHFRIYSFYHPHPLTLFSIWFPLLTELSCRSTVLL